jgi:hypothetical protein
MLPSLERGFSAQRWCSSPWKLRGGQYSLKHLTEFTMLKKGLHPLASNINGSLTRAAVNTPFSSIGRFGKSWSFSPKKTLWGGQYSLKQLTQFTVLNKEIDHLAYNINGSPTGATVLLPFTCMVQLGKGWCSSHFKMLTDRHCSSYFPTQFSVITGYYILLLV